MGNVKDGTEGGMGKLEGGMRNEEGELKAQSSKRKTEDRNWKSEGGMRKSEVGKKKSKFGGQKTEDRGQMFPLRLPGYGGQAAPPPAKKTAGLIEKETEKKRYFQSKLPSLYLLETTVFNHQIWRKNHIC
jgi:hypothetical protein